MGRIRKKCEWCGDSYIKNENDFSLKNSVVGKLASVGEKDFCSKRCKHDYERSSSTESANDDFRLESSGHSGDEGGVSFKGIARFIKWSLILFGLGWLAIEYMSK